MVGSYVDNKARLTWKMVRLGAKIGDLHAKDSSSFCKRLIQAGVGLEWAEQLLHTNPSHALEWIKL
jgi:hypothetical protein